MPFDRNPDGTIYQRHSRTLAHFGEKPVRARAQPRIARHALLHTLYQRNLRRARSSSWSGWRST